MHTAEKYRRHRHRGALAADLAAGSRSPHGVHVGRVLPGAGRPFPPADSYGSFPQLENGIGLASTGGGRLGARPGPVAPLKRRARFALPGRPPPYSTAIRGRRAPRRTPAWFSPAGARPPRSSGRSSAGTRLRSAWSRTRSSAATSGSPGLSPGRMYTGPRRRPRQCRVLSPRRLRAGGAGSSMTSRSRTWPRATSSRSCRPPLKGCSCVARHRRRRPVPERREVHARQPHRRPAAPRSSKSDPA